MPAFLALAAGAGAGHTLAGPDHYAPLIAFGRAREWGIGRAAAIAAGFGLAHCLVSVTIAAGLVAVAASQTPEWLEGMAVVAAWTMIASGVALAIRAWRGQHSHRPALAFLSLAFLVGPCEWLIPVAVAAGTTHGTAAALLVGAVYTACTVATMVGATLLGLFGLRRIVSLRHADWLAASATAACGALMLLGF